VSGDGRRVVGEVSRMAGAALGWSVFGVVVLVILVLSLLLVNYYSDPNDTSTTLTKTIGAVALTVALLAALLIPVDVFIVSSDKIDADVIGVKSLYIVFYSIILVSLFGLLPFGYFYYEEEEGPEESRRGAQQKMSISSPTSPHDTDAARKAKQSCRALKYTLMFLTVMVLLLVIGIVLSNGGPKDSSAPVVKKVESYFAAKDVILAFAIACLMVVGMVGWITYTAYGMALLPVFLFPRRKSNPESDSKKFSVQDLESKLLKIDSRLQYYVAKGFKTQADESTIRDLKTEKRKYELLIKEKKKSPEDRSDRTSVREKTVFVLAWPFRMLLAILSLALALLVVVSLAITIFDRGLNSPCGFKCGFVLNSPTMVNPLNAIQLGLAKYFPADYVFFSMLVLFFFACSLVGLLDGGVRIFCLKLYDITPRKTMQNALLSGIWLLCFVLVGINVFVTDLLSQYTSFGDQRDPEGRMCTFEDSSAGHCEPTQISVFILGMKSKLPAFGVIFYFSQVVFVLSYGVIGLYSLWKCKNRLQETEGYEVIANDDDDMKV
jgi:LMBR1 domain-containing protein 1